MSPTQPVSGSDDPSQQLSPPTRGKSARIKRPKPRLGTAGVVAWSALIILLILSLYYGLRISANRDRLVDRNLRELDRMGRTIQGRLDGFLEVLEGWGKDHLQGDSLPDDTVSWPAPLIPDLVGSSLRICHDPLIQISQEITLCFLVRGEEYRDYTQPNASQTDKVPTDAAAADAPTAGTSTSSSARSGGIGVGGSWGLDPLRNALDPALFDAVFLADSEQEVLLAVTDAKGIRLKKIPADSAELPPPDRSMVRTVTVAGGEYQLFLQPFQVRAPDGRMERKAPLEDFIVGGLVATARFRGESLALGTGHVVFLGTLLLLTILALPFLRVTLIGPLERISKRDIYFLSLSLVLTSGLLGLLLADLSYHQRLTEKVDVSLDSLAGKLSDTLGGEIRSILRELEVQSDSFAARWAERYPGVYSADSVSTLVERSEDSTAVKVKASLLDKRRIFWDSVGSTSAPGSVDTSKVNGHPYLGFQMVFWTDAEGMQVAKWTPRDRNTQPVSVQDRPYFARIDDRARWEPWDTLSGDYHLQSLLSKTTGEHIAAVSIPFCWSQDWKASACSRDRRGVAVMIVALSSVDRPVLPPGVEFAVIDSGGGTLFHSRPERNLEENLLEETSGNPVLRSLISARVSGPAKGTYMGRSSRFQTRPIHGTRLSLVAILEDRYLGTIHVLTWFSGLAVFCAWVMVLWILFLLVEVITPGRLRWAWPDREVPRRHWVLTGVLAAFALVLLIQCVLAVGHPVHSSSLLVPVQALALGLVILSKKPKRKRRFVDELRSLLARSSFRIRDPVTLGGIACGVATLLLIVLHLRGQGDWTHWLLLTIDGVVLAGAGCAVVFAPLGDKDASPERVHLPYVLSILLALSVVGLLPGYLFYQDRFNENLERLVRHQQVEIEKGFGPRAARLTAAMRQNGFSENDDTLFARESEAGPLETFFASTVVEGPFFVRKDSTSGNGQGQPASSSDSAPREPADATPSDSVCKGEVESDFRRVLKPVLDSRPWYAIWAAPELLNLTRSDADGYDWSCPGDALELRAGGYTIRSNLPAGLWRPKWWWGGTLFMGGLILLWLARWIGRRIFLLDLAPPGPESKDHALGPSKVEAAGKSSSFPGDCLFVVCGRSADRRRIRKRIGEEIRWVDLLSLISDDQRQNTEILRAVTRRHDAICFDHFDQQLHQASWGGPLLAQLEKLVYARHQRVVLLSSQEPGTLFPQSGDIETSGAEEELRWIRLLGRFIKIGADDLGTEAPESATTDGLQAPLKGEATEQPFLKRIGLRIDPGQGARRLSHAELVDRVREMADTHYRALWSVLGLEEKLVVYQLAVGAVVNSKCQRAVRRLLARRILVRDPELKLMNQSFGKFVREEISPSTIMEWERREPVSAWQRLRFPILLALFAGAAFLFATQRPAFDTMVAVLSTVAVGTTALVKLLSATRSSERGG